MKERQGIVVPVGDWGGTSLGGSLSTVESIHRRFIKISYIRDRHS